MLQRATATLAARHAIAVAAGQRHITTTAALGGIARLCRSVRARTGCVSSVRSARSDIAAERMQCCDAATSRLIYTRPPLSAASHSTAAACDASAVATAAAAASVQPGLPLPAGWVRCFVGLGGNAGHRARNIHAALALLQQLDPAHLQLHATSLLYESTPVGSPPEHAAQPRFLNAALELRTDLAPLQLLDRLKEVERRMGRDMQMVRNGPRIIDLDILMYGSPSFTFDDARLQVPHPRWSTRGFVLVPLRDLLRADSLEAPGHADTTEMADQAMWVQTVEDAFQQWNAGERAKAQRVRDGDASAAAEMEQIYRVIAFPNVECVADSPSPALSDVWRWGTEEGAAASVSGDASVYPRRIGAPTIVMAILNLTPDSFSDGGVHVRSGVDGSVADAKALWDAGADIIDIGGESTRPGSVALTPAEELDRILPVIDAIRARYPFIKLSVDTYHPAVARQAVLRGCAMINDVYGGTFRETNEPDQSMLHVAAALNVPYVCMHTRGTAQTMAQFTSYSDVVRDVRNEQDAQFAAALDTRAPILSAIPAASASASASSPSPSSASTASSPLYRWNLIADPGIGFAKTGAHAVQLLRRLGEVRDENQFPLLVGTSRKGFIAHALRYGQQAVEARHQHDGSPGAQTTIAQTAPTAPLPLEDRDWGTSATVVASIMAGANIVRVHDVHATRCVRDVADQIYRR